MFSKDHDCKVAWCRASGDTAKELCNKHYRQYYAHDIRYDLYLDIVNASGGECANPGCNRRERLAMDHDHSICEGNKACVDCFRGMLCTYCNMALGALGDDEDRIRGLWFYLKNVV